ncbi:MAG: ATP-binding protein [Vicinamibacteraceae bacterium]
MTARSTMAWLRRPAAVFALVGVVATAVAAFEYRDQRRAHRDTQQMYQGLITGLGAVADLQYEIQEARRSMLYALTTTDSNRQLEYVDRSRGADARVTAITHRLATASDGAETQALIATLQHAWTEYLRGRDEVIASILEGQVTEAVARDLSEGAPAFERVRKALGAVESRQHRSAEARLDAVASLSTRSLIRVVGILCVMQVLALVVLRMVQRASVLETVQRSDARLRDIVSSINEGMFVIGPDGRVESWNDAAERATGVGRRTLVGQRLEAALPAFATALASAPTGAGNTERPTSTHEIAVDVEGAPRVLELRVFPFDGGATGFFTDVTARSRHEAELRKTRDTAEAAVHAKSEFLARMSHEIRTPMNGVLGMTALLFDTPLSAEQRECATVVHESAEHLMHVIDDILDFSKIEAGKLRIEHVAFGMADVLEQALAIVAPAAERKGLELRMEAPRVPLPQVLGDPHRLRQVLINLLGNAIKFTAEGGVTLKLSPTGVAHGEAAVRVEVVDTGIGIDQEALDRLFRAFEQADGSMSRRFGGTGLGLAITRQLIELMGGHVGVDSRPGTGSTFWFELTMGVAIADTATVPTPAAPDVLARAALGDGGLDVLLAEDNPVNTRVAVAMLKRSGHRVTVAENGLAVLANLEQKPFDVVLMDCHMPEMDGFEATLQLRAAGNRVRIIALTASAMEDERAHCFAVGMDDFLAKPLTAANLRDALSKVRTQAAA